MEKSRKDVVQAELIADATIAPRQGAELGRTGVEAWERGPTGQERLPDALGRSEIAHVEAFVASVRVASEKGRLDPATCGVEGAEYMKLVKERQKEGVAQVGSTRPTSKAPAEGRTATALRPVSLK